jgi:hypothetical protein
MRVRPKFFLLLALPLVFTYIFFAEYLPPLRRVHIPYDLQGYHYPLNDYAFRALQHRRLPEWDPTIYCGMSFAANLQTQTFYPPMWLLYLANLPGDKLNYQSLEIFVFLHVWLTFVLSYIWLTRRGLLPMAAILGAGIFAYSGYMCVQLQHLGLIATYTWLPLGFWGIDGAIERNTLRPLWKLFLASALAFLAGYPPTWIVFGVCMLAYAAFRHPASWKTVAGVAAALALSLLPCMVQLLPAFEASGLKEKTVHYGPGIRDPLFYLPYLIPNYFDYGLKTPIFTNYGYEYLYLGAAAFFGLFWAVRRASWRSAVPFLAIVASCFLLVANPFGVVWAVIQHSKLLADVIRGWYYLAGITAGIAGIAALGLDAYLRGAKRTYPQILTVCVIAAIAVWSYAQLRMWLPGSHGVPVGWRSGALSLTTLLLLWAALLLYRSATGNRRRALALAIVLAAAVDYKVFGTSLRQNGAAGDVDRFSRSLGLFPGMSDANYQELLRHLQYRVVNDVDNGSLDMRHYGLTTPQGADPLMPSQYRQIAGNQPGESFQTIDPSKQKDLFRMLAVRYILSFEGAPHYSQLLADPDFRPLPPDGAFFRIFEFRDAQPPYRWDGDSPGSAIRPLAWEPEEREFQVTAAQQRKFVLIEQLYPGWEAWVDGRKVPIELWNGAFQAISVGPGQHRVLFRFRSRTLRWGAAISLLSVLTLVPLIVLWHRRARP